MIPNAAANPIRTSISGTTARKSAPNNISLLKPEIAQAWGVILAMNWSHLGKIKRGHQQPPRGTSKSEVTTAMEPALCSVLTKVASIMPKVKDISTSRSERRMTAPGESPRSVPKTKDLPLMDSK